VFGAMITGIWKENRMSETIADRYRRWFDYERDAHTKVIRSMETVPSDRRSLPEFRRAVAILAHVVAARKMWLGRLGVIAHAQGPLFPEDPDLARVLDELHAVENTWADYLRSLFDEDLARNFEYQSLDAGRIRNRIEDILAQLFGHSWYHRGQIAMLVRAAGGEPAVTDFIYWCREPS
jgi:uncharacterized damage-inducible protein DinB